MADKVGLPLRVRQVAPLSIGSHFAAAFLSSSKDCGAKCGEMFKYYYGLQQGNE